MFDNKNNIFILLLFVVMGMGIIALGSYIVGMSSSMTETYISEMPQSLSPTMTPSKIVAQPIFVEDKEENSLTQITGYEQKILQSGADMQEGRQFQYEESIAPERPVKMSIKEKIIEYPSAIMGNDIGDAYLPLPENTITNTGKGLTENPLAKDSVKKDRISNPLWLANAVPFVAQDVPVVAIVIDDMGVDSYHTKKIMEIDAPLTLAFLPYAPKVRNQAERARKKGYELLIHVPMEPQNLKANNPGPGALLLKNTQAENLGRLKTYFSQMDGYVGINNHMGSAFTADTGAMMPIITELNERGLLFLDSRTSPDSKGDDLAQLSGIAYAKRDVFLDHDPSLAGVEASLAQLEIIAKKYGSAIAIGHPKGNTITALKNWIPTLKEKGIQVVPLTTVARQRMAKRNTVSGTAVSQFKID